MNTETKNKAKAFLTKNSKKITAVTALAALCGVSGTYAFFTDGDVKTNEFTVGSVQIDEQEPHWVPKEDKDGDGTPDRDQTVPKQEFYKDPQIKNIGKNRAFIFMKVTIPYRNLVTVNDTGLKNDGGKAHNVQLWSYDVKGPTANAPGWIEIPNPDTSVKSNGMNDGETKTNTAGDASSELYVTGYQGLVKESGLGLMNKTNGTVTHLYAYVKPGTDPHASNGELQVLPEQQTSGSLFDYIRFVNAVEDQGLENNPANVDVTSFAIQEIDLNDQKDKLDNNNADGKTNAIDVWSVLTTQDTTKISDKDIDGVQKEDDQDVIQPIAK